MIDSSKSRESLLPHDTARICSINRRQSSIIQLMRKILGLTLLLAALNCFAQNQKEGPCKQIEDACVKAGFVKGEAKEGYGLWVDCIDPIMKGTPQPSKAKKPLPAVGAAMINACKAKNPNFGEGHGTAPKK